MSRVARDWAWNCRGLTPALRCILLALAEHADEGGCCWPSLTRLATLTEVDRRTVTRGLAELESRGLVARDRSQRRATTYALAICRPIENDTRAASPDCPRQDETLPRLADSRARGVSPLQQGCEAPRGVKPLGARDPQSRGVRPPGSGVTPPEPGASDPPNRHKNRQGTESEPTLCGDDAAQARDRIDNESSKATQVPANWQPGERVFAWAAKQGMPRDWVEAQIDEFLVYWTDAGERRKSWDATFMNRLQSLQGKQPRDKGHEPERRLADKDYLTGATPLDQIPWLNRAAIR